MVKMGACSEPSANPDDWFIGKDGRQYPDDEWLSEAERARAVRSVLPIAGETPEEHARRAQGAIAAAERARKREALRRRRDARSTCHHECPIRAACLEQWLDERHSHGIWGGYFEEELRQIGKRIPNTN